MRVFKIPPENAKSKRNIKEMFPRISSALSKMQKSEMEFSFKLFEVKF